MLSKEKLADIVKDEIENEMRNGIKPVGFYYVLLNRKIYSRYKYDEEVEEGKHSSNDIYAYVDVDAAENFDELLFHIDYLDIPSVEDIVYAYLRKMGFTIVNEHDELPAPNLKYYISAVVEYNDDTPEYLVVNIYDIDALARTLHIPQIAEQELGSKPRRITTDDVFDIKRTVINEQPLIAGYTYGDAWHILYDYFAYHKKEYHAEAAKIALAYMKLFPISYPACYEWHKVTQMFIETNRLKMELRKHLKRSS